MKNSLNKHFKVLRVIGVIILLAILLGYWGNNKQLKGLHFFENIISDGEYTFYVEADQTKFYTFDIGEFNENMSYEVYDIEYEELISKGRVGYVSEGYRPFIEMALTEGNTYKIILDLENKNTLGLTYIRLLD